MTSDDWKGDQVYNEYKNKRINAVKLQSYHVSCEETTAGNVML